MHTRHRRSVLRAIAGVGVAGIAGCFGGDGGGEAENGSGSGSGGDSDDGGTETETDESEDEVPAFTGPVDPTFRDKFTPVSADQHDHFGWSLAASGDVVIAGAYRDEYPAEKDPGTAYVYERSGGNWLERAELTGGAFGDDFAASVAAGADTILVGAPGTPAPNGAGVGSVYVYERGDDGWSEPALLGATDGKPYDAFGTSVALGTDLAVIGATGDATFYGTDSGAAYVFVPEEDGWTQAAKLKAANGGRADKFGQSVAVSGETILVGAHRSTPPGGRGSGTVHVFRRREDQWTQVDTLGASDDGADRLGWAVDASGDLVVAGAPGDGDDSQGAAYVFERGADGWTRQATLAGDGGDGQGGSDRFGHAVAILDTVVIVGAPLDDDPNGTKAGSAHVFQRVDGSWTSQGKLSAPYGQVEDRFAWSVALTPEDALTGTPRHERPAGRDVGAVQVFDL